jgi:hypothetical protein
MDGKIFHAKSAQRQAGVAMLISDKTDTKQNYQKRQKRPFHTDKGNHPTGGDNNCKDICTEHRHMFLSSRCYGFHSIGHSFLLLGFFLSI